MRVPFAKLEAETAVMLPALAEAATSVLASGRYIGADDIAAFERALASFHDVEHAVGVSSGTDALLASLMALDVGPGDEIITPAFTFVATFEAIARLGATAVFVDILPETWNIDPALIKDAVTPRTKAIVPVSLFGAPCGWPQVELPIVEDAAQAFGTPVRGLASCLSFFPSKILGGFGDGGAVLTNNSDFAARLRKLRVHGDRGNTLGGNFRLDVLQASLLAVKLSHVAANIEKRRACAARYRQLLSSSRVRCLADAPGHTYNYFVVELENRDAIRDKLTQAGIETRVYYPHGVHTLPAAEGRFRQHGPLSVTEHAAKCSLALPLHPLLTDKEQQLVVQQLVTAM